MYLGRGGGGGGGGVLLKHYQVIDVIGVQLIIIKCAR